MGSLGSAQNVQWPGKQFRVCPACVPVGPALSLAERVLCCFVPLAVAGVIFAFPWQESLIAGSLLQEIDALIFSLVR